MLSAGVVWVVRVADATYSSDGCGSVIWIHYWDYSHNY